MDNTKAHEKYFPKNLNSGLRTNSVTAVTLIEQAAWLGLLRKKKNCIGKNATYLRQEKQVKRNARVTTSERSYYFWAPKFDNKDTIIIPYHTHFYFYHQEKQLICEIVLFT